MTNGIVTFFEGKYAEFINWLGSAEAAVIAEGKTIIDELVPVIKQDLLADGTAAFTAVTTALASGTGIGALVTAAEALLPVLASQGITLSKEAATVLVAFLSTKLEATSTPASMPAPVPAS
jgi:hypothetical protein